MKGSLSLVLLPQGRSLQQLGRSLPTPCDPEMSSPRPPVPCVTTEATPKTALVKRFRGFSAALRPFICYPGSILELTPPGPALGFVGPRIQAIPAYHFRRTISMTIRPAEAV